MKKFIHLSSLAFLLLFFIAVKAQEPTLKFQQLTIKDGLSQSTTKGIIQDKYGFIWIGTQDGLNRFDGSNFKVFKNVPKESTSLSDNFVQSLYKDHDEQIWIGTELGLDKYDYDTESFTNFKIKSQKSNTTGVNGINVITESIKTPGLLWLGTNNGICSFDKLTQKCNNFNTPYSNAGFQADHPVLAIHESKSDPGILWVGSADGLFHFNVSTGIFKQIGKDYLQDVQILSIYEDFERTIWLSTNNGLFAFSKNTGKISRHKNDPKNPYSISSNYVQKVFEDSMHNLWIGTAGGGLNIFNRESAKFTQWGNQTEKCKAVLNTNIIDIFEDQSGLIWFCTGSSGLSRINPNNRDFKHLYKDPQNENSLCGNTVRSIIVDSKHQLWVGTTNGISILNLKTKRFKHFFHNPSNSNSISSNQIRAIIEDKKGNIWIGSRDGGLDRYDPITKSFMNYKSESDNPNSLGNNNVVSLYEDEAENLWIGTINGGLSKFIPRTGTFKQFQFDENDSNSINSNQIHSIIAGNTDGILWIGTRNGLAKFDVKSEKFSRYLADPLGKNSLSHHYILGLSKDHLGNIWIATYGGGVNKFNPKTEEFTVYTEVDGLPNNSVYIALEDDENNLWMSTNQGITKFNPKTEEFRNYDTEDGLQASEFNMLAYHKDDEGNLYFGGINGLNIFDPKKITSNDFKAPIVINDFQIFNTKIAPLDTINNRIILTKSILETESIKLSHKENVFSFGFVSLDYSNPEKNEYSYKLENFDSKWNEVGNRNFVTYTNLPAGKYIFKVIGTNSSGLWNYESKSIKITILPPWWKTNMFYFSLIILTTIIIFLYIQLRLRKLNKEKANLEKYVKERTQEIFDKNIILKQKELKLTEANATKDKFFSILAHDLKNPFNIIQGYANILNTEYDDFSEYDRKRMVQEIDKSSKITYKLLDKTLTWSRSQQGKIRIDKKLLNLKTLVKDSIETTFLNAKNKDIQILIEIQNSININGDNFTLSTAIRNLVSNAIKYTPEGGRIEIKAFEENDRIILKVQDNGIGMDKEMLGSLFRIDENNSTLGTNNEIGTGLGLILCKEFIEMNNGDIEVESTIGKGSTFTILLTK